MSFMYYGKPDEAAKEHYRSQTGLTYSTEGKDWVEKELEQCGALRTNVTAPFDLTGDVHPIFRNWIPAPAKAGDDDPSDDVLIPELHQSKLLASRILDCEALPWFSDFFIEDIFSPSYAGNLRPFHENDPDTTPLSIVRHHKARWATPALRQYWCQLAAEKLKSEELTSRVQWGLDDTIVHTKQAYGYTPRYPYTPGENHNVDHPDVVLSYDEVAKYRKQKGRILTVLIMRPFARRLYDLRVMGKKGREEYCRTAFMAAVTMLHELAHVVYWQDFRAINRRLSEPFYGGDLEMELGDSLIASIFGGWRPVLCNWTAGWHFNPTFEGGLAWYQCLNWDYHRKRPRYRAQYAVRMDYIAALFNNRSWQTQSPKGLIRPSTLRTVCIRRTELDQWIADEGLHASAAIRDFEEGEEHCIWRRPSATYFRIPVYVERVFTDDLISRVFNGLDDLELLPPEPDAVDYLGISKTMLS
ncbi:hypothetical protein QBC40DRAFT_232483 [Triangularia verruculosa]|uniref:Uncharacterized protein n=1 Tax=Triangularia verruculosa TaxID=2587418 RepID=A0AAN6XET3_9PEZI|nr:hypothetical protein QBC40DRAFT_232483 [Triangularia verruculosa]